MSAALYDAYMYGKNERALAKQIIGANTGGGFDMSSPDDKSHISEPPDLVDLSQIPDESSPPAGASGATITTVEQEPDLLMKEVSEEEQNTDEPKLMQKKKQTEAQNKNSD